MIFAAIKKAVERVFVRRLFFKPTRATYIFFIHSI
jgi:hypothetical protein